MGKVARRIWIAAVAMIVVILLYELGMPVEVITLAVSAVVTFWFLRWLLRLINNHLHISKRLYGYFDRHRKPICLVLVALCLVAGAVILFHEPIWLAYAAAICIFVYLVWRWTRQKIREIREKELRIRDLSLRATYVLYVLIAMLAATIFSGIVISSVNRMRNDLYMAYEQYAEVYEVPKEGSVETELLKSKNSRTYLFKILDQYQKVVNKFYVDFSKMNISYVYENDEPLSESVETEWYDTFNKVKIMPAYSESDRIKDIILSTVSMLCIPVVYVSAIVLCAFLFYRKKLSKPISILTDASAKITENSLDFRIEYTLRDEMGKLCDSFEKMRQALLKNNTEMWRQMEERKRLNAAFSHDLRTPLTVLKGHTDMLLAGVPDGSLSREETMQELATMSAHVERLENYVSAMSRLQRLEDVDISVSAIDAAGFTAGMKESAEILCGNKQLEFTANLDGQLLIDSEVVTQVYENVLSNAVRYARTKVVVNIERDGQRLKLSVSDDGSGFSPLGLRKATEPFYRSEGSDKSHLGLGLNICLILCKRHGGDIVVQNSENGGARVTAWFEMSKTL